MVWERVEINFCMQICNCPSTICWREIVCDQSLSRVWLLWPNGLEPTRLLHPWHFPGKNAGVGCHFLEYTLYQWLLWHLCENLFVCNYKGLYLDSQFCSINHMSILMPIPSYFDYRSFTASFEIRDWKSFSFILLFFKFILPNLGSHSYINFRIGFSFLLTFCKVLCGINLGRIVSYCLSLLSLGLDRSSCTQSAN